MVFTSFSKVLIDVLLARDAIHYNIVILFALLDKQRILLAFYEGKKWESNKTEYPYIMMIFFRVTEN